jgi:endo-1,4-beta-xylanase
MTGGVALALSASMPCARPMAREHVGLGDLAAAKGLLFGASFSVAELDKPDGEAYANLYKSEAHVLTSELEFKMGTLRPAPDAFNFEPAERLVTFAKANGKKVRGHTLIWNDYLPAWTKALPPRAAEKLLEEHLTAVLTRYRGQVFEWDVVNEPVGPWDRLPGNLRGGPFYAALGERYIDRSFQLAKVLDPGARLFLNEAQTETDDELGRTFRDSLLALVRRLVKEGVPLTGVGLQCHLNSKSRYDFQLFAAFIQEIASLGLEIAITELDCNDVAFPDEVAERDQRVAGLYKRFMDAVLPIKAVKLVTTWQLADEKSWLWYAQAGKAPDARRRPRPLLFDHEYQPKDSYHVLTEAFASMPPR